MFLRFEEILIKLEGIYKYTRIRTGAIASVDYNALAKGIEASDEHFTITESQSSNSYMEKEASDNIVGTLK